MAESGPTNGELLLYSAPADEVLDLSIIIVNWNAEDLLTQCLRSLYNETKNISFEVLVVDNASTDGSPEIVQREFPRVNLIRNAENLGFAKANNQAIRISRGRYVLLLNPDTIVLDNTLAKMVQFLDDHTKIGALGCKLLTAEGKVDFRCARRFPTLWSEICEKTGLSKKLPQSRLFGGYLMGYWDHEGNREVDLLTGACIMVRRDAINQVGLMDEDFFMYGEDVDWCYRIKKWGWKVFYYADPIVIHIGGQSSALVQTKLDMEALRSINLFFRKHYGAPYAWAHKALMLLITVAKEFFFIWKLLIVGKGERRHYTQKMRLHGHVLRWIFKG